MKHSFGLFALAAASLFACAPPEARDDDAVGESTSYQTTGQRVLVRSVLGNARFLTVGAAPPGALEEARYAVGESGPLALNACWAGGVLPSTDPSCEGIGTALGVLGYLDQAGGVPLYRCSGSSGRYPTTDPNCQGQGAREGLLGYVLNASPETWRFGSPWSNTGEGDGTGAGAGGGGGGGADGAGVGGSL